ncbi:unnamed protein product [Toxocara canis]|uniref:Uncharacterized protein n=1 Tax=Toxocara canis TaxID=6265 RepID=A0A183UE27_TOXCA|nr:unnamed protein product [Toxocara canis]
MQLLSYPNSQRGSCSDARTAYRNQTTRDDETEGRQCGADVAQGSRLRSRDSNEIAVGCACCVRGAQSSYSAAATQI